MFWPKSRPAAAPTLPAPPNADAICRARWEVSTAKVTYPVANSTAVPMTATSHMVYAKRDWKSAIASSAGMTFVPNFFFLFSSSHGRGAGLNSRNLCFSPPRCRFPTRVASLVVWMPSKPGKYQNHVSGSMVRASTPQGGSVSTAAQIFAQFDRPARGASQSSPTSSSRVRTASSCFSKSLIILIILGVHPYSTR